LAASAQFTKKIAFQQDIYVTANLGANYFLSEGYRQYTIMQALGAVGRVNIGYRFDPVFGIRAGIGITTHKWPDITKNMAISSFSAENLTADVTVNLLNLLTEYNPNRVCELSVFGGAGVGHRDKAVFPTDNITYILRAGLQADYRLSPVLSLNLEGEVNLVDDNYNNLIDGLPFDIYPAISVGLTYRIPTTRKVLKTIRVNYQQ